MDRIEHAGGCHCGAVRFRVRAPSALEAIECNCSMCAKTGFLHLIVGAEAFTLETDWNALEPYRFNTGVAVHWFCRRCGVKSFYRPRSHPDGYSVNIRCLDAGSFTIARVTPFDGRSDWESARATLDAPRPTSS